MCGCSYHHHRTGEQHARAKHEPGSHHGTRCALLPSRPVRVARLWYTRAMASLRNYLVAAVMLFALISGRQSAVAAPVVEQSCASFSPAQLTDAAADVCGHVPVLTFAAAPSRVVDPRWQPGCSFAAPRAAFTPGACRSTSGRCGSIAAHPPKPGGTTPCSPRAPPFASL